MALFLVRILSIPQHPAYSPTPEWDSYQTGHCSGLQAMVAVYQDSMNLGALRHVQSISQLLCVKQRDYGNVSLVRGSYLFDFDVRQLFVRWFL